MLGEDFGGVVQCDRARMYWAFGRLQWCWAHLRRDFQALIDGPCPTAKRLGHDLMRPTREMFALWKKVRDGTISRRTFRRHMRPVRRRIDALLLRGYFDARTGGCCKELVEHGEHLWTFVDTEGVEPTNNAAERALRHAVMWRKTSYGVQSEWGARFVERVLTVAATCRQQGRDVLTSLVGCCEAWNRRSTPPALITSTNDQAA